MSASHQPLLEKTEPQKPCKETGCDFNSEEAAGWLQASIEVGTATGAVVGGAASLLLFGYKFLTAGAACPTNPIDPCDGTPAVILLALMALPGAVAGAGAGCVAGTTFGLTTAPCVGFFSSKHPISPTNKGPERQLMPGDIDLPELSYIQPTL